MLGRDIDGQQISVTCDGMDETFIQSPFPHDFLLLDTMLLGKPLKIKIMEQPRDPPKIFFLAVAERFRKITHHALHS